VRLEWRVVSRLEREDGVATIAGTNETAERPSWIPARLQKYDCHRTVAVFDYCFVSVGSRSRSIAERKPGLSWYHSQQPTPAVSSEPAIIPSVAVRYAVDPSPETAKTFAGCRE